MRGVLEAADDAASACLAETSLSFVLCCSSAQDEPQGCWWPGPALLGSSRIALRVIRHSWQGADSPKCSSLWIKGGRGHKCPCP